MFANIIRNSKIFQLDLPQPGNNRDNEESDQGDQNKYDPCYNFQFAECVAIGIFLQEQGYYRRNNTGNCDE